MNIIQISLVVVIATLVSITIRKSNPEFAILISIVTGIILVSNLTKYITDTVSFINNLVDLFGLDYDFFALILKIVAISYICEFASGICKDAGFVSNAQKIEVAGKLIIVSMTMPIIMSLSELLLSVI